MLDGALMTGKICTTVLFISLILMVMLPNMSESTVNWIVLTDAAFMLVAFVDYVLAYFGKRDKVHDIPAEDSTED